MPAEKTQVLFYHSVVCPRCHLTGLMLKHALRRHPDIEVQKIEFLTHTAQAHRDGIKSIPSLVAQGRALSGFVLTRRRIEHFLDSLSAEKGGQSPI